jgi:phosphotriesterase-related protein
LDYALNLLDIGVNISIDCFGHFSENDWADVAVETEWQRLAGLVELLRRGFSPQIVLGTDCLFKYHFRRFGGFGYSRLTGYIIPLLRRIEISDYDIRRMTVVNPSQLLAF